MLDDETAQVTAQVVAANGVTKSVAVAVERTGTQNQTSKACRAYPPMQLMERGGETNSGSPM